MAGSAIVQQIMSMAFQIDQSSVQQAQAAATKVKGALQSIVGVIGVTLTLTGIKSFVNQCISEASDFSEVASKFDVVFKSLAGEADEWAQYWADHTQRSYYDIKKYMADMQNLFVGFTDYSDSARKEMMGLSEEAIQLAMDLASFSNIDETRAIELMTKAMMGETECAKTLGAVLNDTTLKRGMVALAKEDKKYLALANAKFKDLSEDMKIRVRLRAIQLQSADAEDDCYNSTTRYESQMRSLNGALKTIRITIGNYLLPAFQDLNRVKTKAVNVVADFTEKLIAFAQKLGTATQVILTLGGAVLATLAIMNIGKVVTFIASIVRLGAAFLATRLAALLMFAGIMLLALVIEDFVAFLQGRNSVIGEWLDEAGFDVDEVRGKFKYAADIFKSSVIPVLEEVGKAFSALGVTIWDFWDKNGDNIKLLVDRIVVGLGNDSIRAAKDFKNNIKDAAETVSSWILQVIAFFQNNWPEIKADLQSLWDWLKEYVIDGFESAKEILGDFWSVFTEGMPDFEDMTVIDILQWLWDFFKDHKDEIANGLETLRDIFLGALIIVTTVINTVKKVLIGLWNILAPLFINIISGVLTVIDSFGFFQSIGEDASTEGPIVRLCRAVGGALETLGDIILKVAGILSFLIQAALTPVWIVLTLVGVAVSGLKKLFQDHIGVLGVLIAVFAAFVAIVLAANASAIAGAIAAQAHAAALALTAKFASVATLWSKLKAAADAIATAVTNAFSAATWAANAPLLIMVAVIGAVIAVLVLLKLKFGSVIEGIKALVEKVKSAIGWLLSLIGIGKDAGKQTGQDIADGIAEGLEEGKDGIADAAEDVANSMYVDSPGVKDAFNPAIADGSFGRTTGYEQVASTFNYKDLTGVQDDTQGLISNALLNGVEGVSPDDVGGAFGAALMGANTQETGTAAETLWSDSFKSVNTGVTGAAATSTWTSAAANVDSSATGESLTELLNSAFENTDASSLNISTPEADKYGPASGNTSTNPFSEQGIPDLSGMDLESYGMGDMSGLTGLSGGVDLTEIINSIKELGTSLTDALNQLGTVITEHAGAVAQTAADNLNQLIGDLRSSITGQLSELKSVAVPISTGVMTLKTRMSDILSGMDENTTQIMLRFTEHEERLNLILQANLKPFATALEQLGANVSQSGLASSLGVDKSLLYGVAGSSRSISTSINITNSYNGDTGYQKAASAAAKNADDSFAQMARAMAYGY